MPLVIGQRVEMVVLVFVAGHTAYRECPQVVVVVLQYVIDIIARERKRVFLVVEVFLQCTAVESSQSGASAYPQYPRLSSEMEFSSEANSLSAF